MKNFLILKKLLHCRNNYERTAISRRPEETIRIIVTTEKQFESDIEVFLKSVEREGLAEEEIDPLTMKVLPKSNVIEILLLVRNCMK